MKIQTGYPFYGQNVGVLVFSTVTPRVPGDAGHAASFSYPVRYEVVRGGFADLIEGGPEIKAALLEAGQRLTARGRNWGSFLPGPPFARSPCCGS